MWSPSASSERYDIESDRRIFSISFAISATSPTMEPSDSSPPLGDRKLLFGRPPPVAKDNATKNSSYRQEIPTAHL